MKDTALALSDLFDILPDAALLVDGAGDIVFANVAVRHVLGYEPDELIGHALNSLIPHRHRASHAKQVADFQRTGHSAAMGDRPVLHALCRAGDEVPVSISIANLELVGERFSVALVRDATPMREHLHHAITQAETDLLTGIGNRLHLSRHIQGLLATGRTFGLLFLDLSQFKPFNDRYGHRVGDAVLRLVAERMQEDVRSDDLAARLGGDEFVMLLDGLSDPETLRERAHLIVDNLCRPFEVLGVKGEISVNIGGALKPQDGDSEAALLAVADKNMYRAKQLRKPYCGS